MIDRDLLIPRSRSSAKVKVKYQGHVSQKMSVSGALVFHKHIGYVEQDQPALTGSLILFFGTLCSSVI